MKPMTPEVLAAIDFFEKWVINAEGDEVRHGKVLRAALKDALEELGADAALGAAVRPSVKNNGSVGYFFIPPMLLLAPSNGHDDNLDAALARQEATRVIPMMPGKVR